MYGIASFENLGSLRALLTLPPTQMETPSISGSFERHGRTDGVAVGAEHALLFDDFHRLLAVDRRRPNGARRTGGNRRRDLALRSHQVVLDVRKPPVHAQNGDVRAVHGAAHVEAAGKSDAQLGRAASAPRSKGRAHPSGTSPRPRHRSPPSGSAPSPGCGRDC